MVIKTLELSLGSIVADPPEYATGWYRDPATGQYYYYDATNKKWYIYAAGVLQPLAIAEQSAPKTISVIAGDKVKVSISYKYTGPAITGAEEYFSIGYKDALGYHPKIEGTNSRNLPTCSTATLFTAEKTLVIPTGVGENWNHIECKVWHGTPDVPETGLRYLNALTIVGLVAAITEFTIVDYVKV
jgi:hypothetical protein